MSTNSLHWHPTFDNDREKKLVELKAFLKENVINKYPGTIPEFAKFTDSGIINQNPKVIQKMYPQIKEYVDANYPDFEVHYTDVSINVISRSTNKGAGIKFLCELLNLKLDEVAFIGDTGGDIPGLKIVGKPFAPKNAHDSVKEIAEVMDSEDANAVLEAYQKIIAYNRIQ